MCVEFPVFFIGRCRGFLGGALTRSHVEQEWLSLVD